MYNSYEKYIYVFFNMTHQIMKIVLVSMGFNSNVTESSDKIIYEELICKTC